jgi:hypothetical protein
MKSSIFWDVTPYSPLKINLQRTTRYYIPEDRTLHTLLLRYKMYVLRPFTWCTTRFTFVRKILATIQKNRRQYADVSHFYNTCDFGNSEFRHRRNNTNRNSSRITTKFSPVKSAGYQSISAGGCDMTLGHETWRAAMIKIYSHQIFPKSYSLVFLSSSE